MTDDRYRILTAALWEAFGNSPQGHPNRPKDGFKVVAKTFIVLTDALRQHEQDHAERLLSAYRAKYPETAKMWEELERELNGNFPLSQTTEIVGNSDPETDN